MAVSRRLTSRSSSNPACFSAEGVRYVFTYGYTTVTDQQGRFAFDRVVPIPGTVSRVAQNVAAPSGIPASGWQVRVEVKPNQTARVRIGGKGRVVVGRLVVEGTPEAPVDWTKNQPVVLHVPHEGLKDSLDWRQFASHINKDGRFHIEDVPPGKYVLEATVNAPSYPQVWGRRPRSVRRRFPSSFPKSPTAGPTSRSTWGR